MKVTSPVWSMLTWLTVQQSNKNMHDQSRQHDLDQGCYSQINTLTHSKNNFTYSILYTSDLSETLFKIFWLLLELDKNHLVKSLGYCSEFMFNKNTEHVTFLDVDHPFNALNTSSSSLIMRLSSTLLLFIFYFLNDQVTRVHFFTFSQKFFNTPDWFEWYSNT